MQPVRAGVIGCGGIALGKHLPALAELGDAVRVDAFCDLILERAEEAKARFGHPAAGVFTDYRRVLDLPLDAIYVLTPNRWHAEITVAALSAGKHVICEKPMATTAREADAMVRAAEEAGRVLTIGYQNRWRPDAQYLKNLCEQNALGHVYYARALALRRRGVPGHGVFLSQTEQGGGALIDIGTHALDLALWLMDNYEPRMVVGATFHELAEREGEVNPWGQWKPSAFEVEEAAFGFIKMADGSLISLESSWAMNLLEVGEAEVILAGTEAGADMRDGVRINRAEFGALATIRPELKGRRMRYTGVDLASRPELTEARQFLRAVRGEAPPPAPAKEAAVVTAILEAVYTSARTGEPVWLGGREPDRKG